MKNRLDKIRVLLGDEVIHVVIYADFGTIETRLSIRDANKLRNLLSRALKKKVRNKQAERP